MGLKNRTKGLKLLGTIFIVMGILAVMYSIIARSLRATSGGLIFALLGLFLIGAGLFKIFFLKQVKSKLLKFFVSALHVLIFLGFLSFLIIEGIIINSAVQKDTRKPDYIVVLGAGLWGKTPSTSLVQRLEAALKLHMANPDTKIIVSGGQGPGETTTEANAMKEYLVGKGIREDLIIKEGNSTSTLENLCFSRDVIRKTDERDNLTITIVTSNFHMYRARFIAGRLGFKSQGYSSEILPGLIPAYFTREYLAIIKSFIFDHPSRVSPVEVGVKTDSYKGVDVFNNGSDYTRNYGQNYSKDGYYYGYKWQCVEYIKRFFYEAKGHKMPDVYGHAKDFFNPSVKHGDLNKARGLYQYKNGEDVKPEVDDLIVFTDTTYGHVAIVTEVGKDYIEVIQQNIYKVPREKFSLSEKNGKYLVGDKRQPAGWLRKK